MMIVCFFMSVLNHGGTFLLKGHVYINQSGKAFLCLGFQTYSALGFPLQIKKWTARTRVTGYVLFRFWFTLGGTLKSRQFDCDSWSFKWFINYISYPFYYWGLPQNIDKWVKSWNQSYLPVS